MKFCKCNRLSHILMATFHIVLVVVIILQKFGLTSYFYLKFCCFIIRNFICVTVLSDQRLSVVYWPGIFEMKSSACSGGKQCWELEGVVRIYTKQQRTLTLLCCVWCNTQMSHTVFIRAGGRCFGGDSRGGTFTPMCWTHAQPAPALQTLSRSLTRLPLKGCANEHISIDREIDWFCLG